MAKIYVASSWRNKYQPEVVAALRAAGHEVYDFRNPENNPGGFHWDDVDPSWQVWEPAEYTSKSYTVIAFFCYLCKLEKKASEIQLYVRFLQEEDLSRKVKSVFCLL